ncbi:Two-component sensor protein histidine protein kinase [Taphrina deformans PYCC 5710]|uniref:histidine kinase n=1 Tax=Taphrina deformans (strain PYCC 5710 / ATCC 11124 / CBS 356.35 / IMI 108563 / JCM 9778 / NBRC 8474) TaxID=1097556 RepID=R4XCM5_TAPDE|nr:Two-component sensor protein histidine protein kinase [Taphrina deformans PYCC 5710]|eukprot:CCG82126.1 Two-component sensor protein histidine protein kinase [Taphrina deformans PYCC 5710]
MATFREQSFGTRLRKIGRAAKRLQYPLSEPSEPIFDLERYGASSNYSNSTRHSASTFRRNLNDDLTRSETHDSQQQNIDIVVVDRKFDSSLNGKDTNVFTERQTTVDGSDQESTRYGDLHARRSKLVTLLSTVSHYLNHFFFLSFQDPAKERHYQKETWFLSKRIAIWTSLYFYIAWALVLAFYARPWHSYDYIAWIGLFGLGVIPLLPAVLYDVPARYPWIWKICLMYTTWIWSALVVTQLIICDYYGPRSTCGSKDFVGLFYYLIAMPTMSLFALGSSRLLHTVGTIATLAYIGALLIPMKKTWIRHFFNFLLFQIFILYLSYAREKSNRKIFNLRDQLKAQYKATQKAQVAESRASDSKKRFVNYIFHEVRVPLNTSLLAIQNLIGEDVFRQADEEQIELVDVLQSSLGMMEKVLNDVLDFNRMEAGKLLCASTPFDFSKVIRSVFLGLTVAASSKSVSLKSELDPRLEQLGDLIGDEMRLRQILSNLTSNACKFTSQGGSVTLITKLLLPEPESTAPQESYAMDRMTNTYQMSTPNLKQSANENTSNLHKPPTYPEKVTVRIEVHDTGMGIRAQDVKDDRLFSPYVQTEIGKRQGGKGTGLGLALVRNIVQLSGGRLGLKSTPGEGSIFWVEQEYAMTEPANLRQFLLDRVPSTESSHTTAHETKIDDVCQVTGQDKQLSESIQDSESDHVHAPIVHFETNDTSDIEMITPPLTTSTMHDVVAERREYTGSPSGLHPDHRPSLVQLHSSEIEVLPASRTPSDPQVTLPRPYAPADTTIAAPSESITVTPDIDSQPLSVLVVDDDLLTRRLMTRMISRLGHQVQSVENGLLALNLVRLHFRKPLADQPVRTPFDIVFLDNQMPVLSGVEMVTRARMEGIDTMVVGVTGNAMREDQDEYLECGADFVLIKPVMEPSISKMLVEAKVRRKIRLATNAE